MYKNQFLRRSGWASVPVVIIGLLLATFAVFKAPWPPDPTLPYSSITVKHQERLQGVVPEPLDADKNLAWRGRRIMDRSVYDLLVIGFVGIVLAAWRHDRRLLLILMCVGGLGILYSASIGLYLGPILAVVGFSLVLFGAGLNWASGLVQTGLENQTHETHSAA
jgi:hypothetical protein